MKLNFLNVGRDHKNWTEDFAVPIIERSLINSIRQHHALMSRDIEFEWNDDDTQAVIYAGIRAVGRIEVTA